MEKSELKYYWMLHEIAKSLGMAENLQAVLNMIVKSTVDNLELKASSIRLLCQDKRALTLEAAYGLTDKYLRKGPVEVDRSPIDREAMKGEPVLVREVEKDARMLQYPDEAKKEGIASMVCVPLIVKDEVVGSLRGYASKIREFSDAEISFLTALGNLGAIAIENARLNRRLIKKAEIMKTLLDITETVTSTLDRNKILDRIVRASVETLNARGCSLRLLDEKKEQLDLASSIGLSLRYSAKGSLNISEEIKETLEGKIVTIYDISSDKRVHDKESLKKERVSSILAAPITKKNKVIGVLKVYDSLPRRFEEEEVEFLSLLAGIGGVALENARLYKLALTNWEEVVKSLWEKSEVWGATYNPYDKAVS